MQVFHATIYLPVMSISVIINTRNEEKNLPRALASVKALADEIVVVDMESTDKTVEIAKKEGAKVFSHKPTGYVEPARNFALRKAQGKHILILDADEEISPGLAKFIKKEIKKPTADYFRIPRKNIIFNKWIEHSRWWPDYNIRFFKKGKVSWSEVIHSVPMTQGRGLDLAAKESLALIHHHYQTIEQFINRLNNYTTQHAKLRLKEGYKFSWRDLIGKPVEEFLSRYFVGEGYKDGIHGLALSGLQAFSEMVLYLKIWQAEKFKEEMVPLKEVISQMKEAESQTRYWQADTLLKEHGGIVNRIKRKLKLR